MSFRDVVALAIFGSYFTQIIFIFQKLVRSIVGFPGSQNAHPWRGILLFSTLTAASFGHTWFYMIKYLLWSFRSYEDCIPASQHENLYERLCAWLLNTELFEQAWSQVCRGVMNWWWSEQLCIFTAGFWTTFIFIEGRKRSIPHLWAYMLFGQIVAISTASSLFYVAVIAKRASHGRDSNAANRHQMAPLVLVLSVLLSLASVAISPSVSGTKWFLPNLLAMHALLFVPLLSSNDHPSVPASQLYQAIALISIILRTRSVGLAWKPLGSPSVSNFVSEARQTLSSHPAQSSIGWDIVWTGIVFITWSAYEAAERGKGEWWNVGGNVAALAIPIPFLSVSTVAPLWASAREKDGITSKANDSARDRKNK